MNVVLRLNEYDDCIEIIIFYFYYFIIHLWLFTESQISDRRVSRRYTYIVVLRRYSYYRSVGNEKSIYTLRSSTEFNYWAFNYVCT